MTFKYGIILALVENGSIYIQGRKLRFAHLHFLHMALVPAYMLTRPKIRKKFEVMLSFVSKISKTRNPYLD